MLSVIIPTRNRSALLQRALVLLADQIRETGAELLIVDDGSSDDTSHKVQEWIRNSFLDAHLLRQPPKGPAVARNRGLFEAKHPLVLFLGDDIFPAPGMLQAHLSHHEAYPDRKVAVLGRVTWNPKLKIDALMRWLENGGPQFCYNMIDDPLNVPPTFFWTANLSVKAGFLKDEGGFSPKFPDAAFEDVELGVRLGKKGLNLHYEPQALGYHHHPITLNHSLERMRRLAKGAVIASETVPRLIFIGNDTRWKRTRRKIVLGSTALWMIRFMGPLLSRVPCVRDRYFALAHDLYYKAAIRHLVEEEDCSQ